MTESSNLLLKFSRKYFREVLFCQQDLCSLPFLQFFSDEQARCPKLTLVYARMRMQTKEDFKIKDLGTIKYHCSLSKNVSSHPTWTCSQLRSTPESNGNSFGLIQPRILVHLRMQLARRGVRMAVTMTSVYLSPKAPSSQRVSKCVVYFCVLLFYSQWTSINFQFISHLLLQTFPN